MFSCPIIRIRQPNSLLVQYPRLQNHLHLRLALPLNPNPNLLLIKNSDRNHHLNFRRNQRKHRQRNYPPELMIWYCAPRI